MDTTTVARKINASLPDAEVLVEGQDCNFTVTVISDGFQGVSQLSRQRRVLGCFEQELASGTLHALSVKPFSGVEWVICCENGWERPLH